MKDLIAVIHDYWWFIGLLSIIIGYILKTIPLPGQISRCMENLKDHDSRLKLAEQNFEYIRNEINKLNVSFENLMPVLEENLKKLAYIQGLMNGKRGGER